MSRQPVFSGLVVDEADRPVGTAFVGDEPCYVVDDAGFLRHIPSEQVDRQVLEMMRKQIAGNEDMISEQAAKMLGTEDIFSKAMLETQLKNIDKSFDAILETGIPEESRAYMGMSGFKVVINVHGEVVRLDQPAGAEEGGDGEGE
ncbi:MAG TPA: hypothetical protein VMC09_06855 [Anaerolineales bacterium]|nr:hypothetical protein [Anaerolineales bacterium]